MDKSTFEKWICPNLRVILPKLAFVCVIIFGVLLFLRNSHNFARWGDGEVLSFNETINTRMRNTLILCNVLINVFILILRIFRISDQKMSECNSSITFNC